MHSRVDIEGKLIGLYVEGVPFGVAGHVNTLTAEQKQAIAREVARRVNVHDELFEAASAMADIHATYLAGRPPTDSRNDPWHALYEVVQRIRSEAKP